MDSGGLHDVLHAADEVRHALAYAARFFGYPVRCAPRAVPEDADYVNIDSKFTTMILRRNAIFRTATFV